MFVAWQGQLPQTEPHIFTLSKVLGGFIGRAWPYGAACGATTANCDVVRGALISMAMGVLILYCGPGTKPSPMN